MKSPYVRRLLPFAFGAALLTGCAEMEEIGLYRTAVPEVSPTAIAVLPDDIEAASLTITDGTFTVEDLYLLEDTPTVLHIINVDEQGYRFAIAEDLVTATEIPPADTTLIEFTTPNADVYQAQLLPEEGDEPLSTSRVVVRSAGAVEP